MRLANVQVSCHLRQAITMPCAGPVLGLRDEEPVAREHCPDSTGIQRELQFAVRHGIELKRRIQTERKDRTYKTLQWPDNGVFDLVCGEEGFELGITPLECIVELAHLVGAWRGDAADDVCLKTTTAVRCPYKGIDLACKLGI